MNLSLPPFEVYVRTEFLYNFEKPEDAPEFTSGIVIGAASVPGRALGFHVLLENGAQFGRLPVWALCSKKKPINLLSHYPIRHQLWDCPSEKCEVITYEAIEGCLVKVRYEKTGDVTPAPSEYGHYRMTFDWWGSATAEGAGDLGWKSGSLIELGDGDYTIQPNNRIQFYLREFTPRFGEIPRYKTMQQTFSVEGA